MQNVETMKFSLKELRARKNWTQAQTAELLGISPQTYCEWEKNFGVVKSRDALRVARLFDVTLDQIFFKEQLENDSITIKK